jgi:ribosome-binding factor A
MRRPKERGRAEPSQRQLRVGELVRHAVSEMLIRGDVHDPVIEGHLITIPEVRMTPDLRLATIYVMPLGGRDKDDVLAALERNKRYLRGEIAHRVNLKFAPDIRFQIDQRFEEAERIEKLLRTPEVQRDLAPPGSEPDEDDS